MNKAMFEKCADAGKCGRRLEMAEQDPYARDVCASLLKQFPYQGLDQKAPQGAMQRFSCVTGKMRWPQSSKQAKA